MDTNDAINRILQLRGLIDHHNHLYFVENNSEIGDGQFDRMINVDVVEGYEVSNELAKKGIFVGQSSGAYLLGARQVAEELTSGHVVTIFNDIGERYFSTSMWG